MSWLAEAKATDLPPGAVVIDETVLAGLKSDAAAGREALEAQTAARRDGIVAKALREGRITPDSRDTWRAALDDNEAMASKLLASMAENTALPVVELGHSDELVSADDAAYAAIFGSSEKEGI